MERVAEGVVGFGGWTGAVGTAVVACFWCSRGNEDAGAASYHCHYVTVIDSPVHSVDQLKIEIESDGNIWLASKNRHFVERNKGELVHRIEDCDRWSLLRDRLGFVVNQDADNISLKIIRNVVELVLIHHGQDREVFVVLFFHSDENTVSLSGSDVQVRGFSWNSVDTIGFHNSHLILVEVQENLSKGGLQMVRTLVACKR